MPPGLPQQHLRPADRPPPARNSPSAMQVDEDPFDTLDALDCTGLPGRPRIQRRRSIGPAPRAAGSPAPRTAAQRKAGLQPWREDEESALLQHVHANYACGAIDWDRVASALGRTCVGCMAKYHSLIDHKYRARE
ncbi:hypothetical protein LPJ61_005151 [Coemansia biformis]|uniref:Myb-like domain-containing protein n=1 Tax=Coemansia biformis TaxID=1286918 RepID=A0A9W8CU16_9FUNG|nr:hypothetical protein LPJ61_005151 [Coemansia biformis]